MSKKTSYTNKIVGFVVTTAVAIASVLVLILTYEIFRAILVVLSE